MSDSRDETNAKREFVQALDFILNKSDEATIEVLAEAVVRRRRDLSVFNTIGKIPDPERMSKEITHRINSGIEESMEGMKRAIREMIVRVVKKEAPELTGKQIEELCDAWLPGRKSKKNEQNEKDDQPSGGMMLSMIEQFVAFSRGTMNEKVDSELREELGEWPKRYWNVFPPVVRRTITDYLKDRITESDFKNKILIALKK